MNNLWKRRMVGMATEIAQWSKDPSTKVGCVLVNPESLIVASAGYNGFPRGVREELMVEIDTFHGGTALVKSEELDPVRWARPLKYQFVEHAERNAIYNAAREGKSTLGLWAFLNYRPQPCADCARALIQAGIIHILGPDLPFPGAGAGTHYHIDDPAGEMLREAHVVQEIVR